MTLLQLWCGLIRKNSIRAHSGQIRGRLALTGLNRRQSVRPQAALSFVEASLASTCCEGNVNLQFLDVAGRVRGKDRLQHVFF